MRLFLLTSILIISTIFFDSTSSIAQSKFVPGSIINDDGDTIPGFINYKKWKQNPAAIKFKTNESADALQYGPEDITSFIVSNDIYQSRTITVTESPNKSDFITDILQQTSVQKPAFVLVLVSGKASLYHFVDRKDIDHFYVETSEQPLMELIYFTYYRYEDDERVQNENLKYIGQLIAYLNDCPDLQTQIQKTKYASEPLKKAVANYNKCLNVSDFYVQKIERTKYRFGVFAGATFSRLSFNDPSETYGYLSDLKFNNSIAPTFGVSMLLEPSRGNGRWALYVDLLFKMQRYNAQYTETHHEDYYLNYDIQLGTTSTNMTFMGRYSFIGHKIVPHVGVGAYFGLNLAFVNQKTIETHFYETNRTRTVEVFPTGIGGFDFGMAAEIGMMYKKFNLDLRFDFEGITPYPPVSTSYSFYLVFGYTFN